MDEGRGAPKCIYIYKRTSLNATALCASRTGTSVRPSVNRGSTAPGWFSIYLFVWFLSLINLQCMSKIREKIWFNQKSESCQTIFLRACFFISTFLVFFWKKWPIDQLRMSIHNQLMIQRAYNVFKWIESWEDVRGIPFLIISSSFLFLGKWKYLFVSVRVFLSGLFGPYISNFRTTPYRISMTIHSRQIE